MASQTKRNKYFDNAKLVLIFLVVFGHVISPLKDRDGILFTLYLIIYFFHMPAFIMISGYFSKGYQKKGYFLKIIKKILIPYFIFQFIYSVFYFINGRAESFQFDIFRPHWSLWFLLSLFFWNILLHLFAKYRWFGVCLAFVLGVAIGYVDNIGNFLSLSRTFVFFPYFLLGFMLNGESLKKIIRSRFSLPAAIVIISAVIIYFGISFPKDALPWLLGDSSYMAMGDKQASAGLFRGLQYLLTVIVVFAFLTLIPSLHFRLTKIGERTLYIYLFHGFVIKPLQAMVPEGNLDLFSGHYLLLAGFSIIICLLLGSYFVKKYTKPIVEPSLPIMSAGR